MGGATSQENLRCSRSIKAYAAYLDTLEAAEEEHPACTANRLLLEHTWQACSARTALQARVRRGMQCIGLGVGLGCFTLPYPRKGRIAS